MVNLRVERNEKSLIQHHGTHTISDAHVWVRSLTINNFSRSHIVRLHIQDCVGGNSCSNAKNKHPCQKQHQRDSNRESKNQTLEPRWQEKVFGRLSSSTRTRAIFNERICSYCIRYVASGHSLIRHLYLRGIWQG